ncbi:hypothetical protein DTL70_20450 [Streptomyces diacarni]|uniref:HTH luxR-type domain-containing protein n=1 Tax=Streptomyces diacarni TaxID=2800381 RepID=A0A367ERS4_9ACTN|nr:LuxR C-terminal-related transcriptional regulator [Streptomyces diacarni]RCG20663.1 hypothetical protein DTL70_20450 [Streptomyces diacarni]
MEPRWSSPDDALARAFDLVAAPLPELLERTSRALNGLVRHTAAAQLSEVSAYAPKQAVGADRDLAARITHDELGQLAFRVRVGAPWWGEAVLGGERRAVLGVAAAHAGKGGALLALTGLRTAAPPPPAVLRTVQRVWDLVTVSTYRLTAEAFPSHTSVSRVAAAARAAVLAELADAHGAALTGVLTALRAPALDDAAARAAATDLAVDALAALGRMTYWNRELSEEDADTAFHRGARELRPPARHRAVRLALRPPGSGRSLPSDTAHTARAATRTVALALLEQEGVGRMHVGWWLEGDTLRIAVRDDGPGRPPADEPVVPANVAERVAALEGTVTADPVPGWGTTVTLVLPLGAPAGARTAAPPTVAAAAGRAARTDRAAVAHGGPHGLRDLHPREAHVLEQVSLGRRNREIARALGISESTVKFHVSNILAKLGVTTRGEAAALTRAWGP